MPNWAKVTIGVLSAVVLVVISVRSWRAARTLREQLAALTAPKE